jgi:transposase-like protein/uncharacterized Zn finger protein (UPF0148 family)
MAIIQLLLDEIHYLHAQIAWLMTFIAKYIPLKQFEPEDSKSPDYQKFKTDILPKFQYHHNSWTWEGLLDYYRQRYGKVIKPVKHRGECDIPEDCICPECGAPHIYLYRNNGKAGQLLCKVCGTRFSPDQNRFRKQYTLRCPYCDRALERKKDRKDFSIYKCTNPNCSYYVRNFAKLDDDAKLDEQKRNEYKLHYIYRELTKDFFALDLDSLPKNASSLRFDKFSMEVVTLCLTYHINYQISLRRTKDILWDIHGIRISHQQIANYCKTAAVLVKPFVDHYDYKPSGDLAADETYIKVRGIKGYVWLIMDAVKRSILGYRCSDNRGVGACILTMRQALNHFREKLPEGFRFIADGYSAYPLAAMQFDLEYGENFRFDITQVIGLTNDDEVSAEFRPFKQLIERLNRTFKSSYRPTCGYDSFENASLDLALWVAYYNFL